MKDPYKILNVPHTASQDEIKRSYRILARRYHPDRVVDPAEKDKSTAAFAEISTAYALLSDSKKKAQYDHIYKYGGFDDEKTRKNSINNNSYEYSQRNGFHGSATPDSTASSTSPEAFFQASRKRKSATGIGYVCSDPLAFLWSQGKVQIRQTVAGIQVPSRLHGNGGLRFAFSAGYVSRPKSGIKQYSCSTTQFCQGKKFTRTETTTIYPDGRKEVVIEGMECGEQRYYTTTCTGPSSNRGLGSPNDEGVTQHDETMPWYMYAWSELKDKLTMCYNPCVVQQ